MSIKSDRWIREMAEKAKDMSSKVPSIVIKND